MPPSEQTGCHLTLSKPVTCSLPQNQDKLQQTKLSPFIQSILLVGKQITNQGTVVTCHYLQDIY